MTYSLIDVEETHFEEVSGWSINWNYSKMPSWDWFWEFSCRQNATKYEKSRLENLQKSVSIHLVFDIIIIKNNKQIEVWYEFLRKNNWTKPQIKHSM